MTQASVLFSGGPDSTLAALYALDRFDRIHLLTFHHCLMSKLGRHVIVTEELREKYGTDRIVTHEESIDDLYKICYFTDINKLLPTYRTFYIPWMCGACKMAMHASTITYNLANNIHTTYDGANKESEPYFPAQTPGYLEVIDEYYRSYGMEHESPVFDVTGTDKETERRGLRTTSGTKQEHIFFSTQHTCYVGLAIHAHARLYYRPFRGKKRTATVAPRLLREMITRCSHALPQMDQS